MKIADFFNLFNPANVFTPFMPKKEQNANSRKLQKLHKLNQKHRLNLSGELEEAVKGLEQLDQANARVDNSFALLEAKAAERHPLTSKIYNVQQRLKNNAFYNNAKKFVGKPLLGALGAGIVGLGIWKLVTLAPVIGMAIGGVAASHIAIPVLIAVLVGIGIGLLALMLYRFLKNHRQDLSFSELSPPDENSNPDTKSVFNGGKGDIILEEIPTLINP